MFLFAGWIAGCAATDTGLPTARTLVVHSGARLNADPDRMEEVDDWIRDQLTAITEDPSFWVQPVEVGREAYPWDGLEIIGDTVRYRVERSASDARTSYEIYAHLRLMKSMGRLEDWIPGGDTLDAYALEQALVERTSDSWLYGRAIFDAQPYGPLDELIYAHAAGWLDAFILTAQADRFETERENWLEDNPGALEEYIAWFEGTFSRMPPGLRAERQEPAAADTTAVR